LVIAMLYGCKRKPLPHGLCSAWKKRTHNRSHIYGSRTTNPLDVQTKKSGKWINQEAMTKAQWDFYGYSCLFATKTTVKLPMEIKLGRILSARRGVNNLNSRVRANNTP
jgi:hypothetical protein